MLYLIHSSLIPTCLYIFLPCLHAETLTTTGVVTRSDAVFIIQIGTDQIIAAADFSKRFLYVVTEMHARGASLASL